MNGMIANIILVIILVAIVGGAIRYIYKSKKRGDKCIGCSSSGGCNCHCDCDSSK